MSSDVDRELARIGQTLERVRARSNTPEAKRLRRHREAEVMGRLGRIAIADAVIIAGAIIAGLMMTAGIGLTGAMIVAALLVGATLLFAALPVAGAPEAEALVQVPIKA